MPNHTFFTCQIQDFPIVNANPNTIYKQLKKLIINHNIRYVIGIKSRKYIENYHDSLKIAKQFKELYEELLYKK